MKNEIQIISNRVASLLEANSQELELNDEICDKVHWRRLSLEFFIAQKNEGRALYEAEKCEKEICKFLGLI